VRVRCCPDIPPRYRCSGIDSPKQPAEVVVPIFFVPGEALQRTVDRLAPHRPSFVFDFADDGMAADPVVSSSRDDLPVEVGGAAERIAHGRDAQPA